MGSVRRLLVLLLVCVLASACASPGGDTAAPGGGGGGGRETASLDFTAATVDGGQLDASSLDGRDVVLWFWAPW
jgi:hypothetical protein